MQHVDFHQSWYNTLAGLITVRYTKGLLENLQMVLSKSLLLKQSKKDKTKQTNNFSYLFLIFLFDLDILIVDQHGPY